GNASSCGMSRTCDSRLDCNCRYLRRFLCFARPLFFRANLIATNRIGLEKCWVIGTRGRTCLCLGMPRRGGGNRCHNKYPSAPPQLAESPSPTHSGRRRIFFRGFCGRADDLYSAAKGLARYRRQCSSLWVDSVASGLLRSGDLDIRIRMAVAPGRLRGFRSNAVAWKNTPGGDWLDFIMCYDD